MLCDGEEWARRRHGRVSALSRPAHMPTHAAADVVGPPPTANPVHHEQQRLTTTSLSASRIALVSAAREAGSLKGESVVGRRRNLGSVSDLDRCRPGMACRLVYGEDEVGRDE